METTAYSQVITLSPEDNHRLLNLCGKCDEHLHLIENRLGVDIKQRGFTFSISGTVQRVKQACQALIDLYHKQSLVPKEVHLHLQTVRDRINPQSETQSTWDTQMELRIKRGAVVARGGNQARYLQNVLKYDINFGIGECDHNS